MPDGWTCGPNDIAPAPQQGGLTALMERMGFIWSHTKDGASTFLDVFFFKYTDMKRDILDLYPSEFTVLMNRLYKWGLERQYFPNKCFYKVTQFHFYFMMYTDRELHTNHEDKRLPEVKLRLRLALCWADHDLPTGLRLGCGLDRQVCDAED